MENMQLQLIFSLLDKIDGFTSYRLSSSESESLVRWLKPDGLPKQSVNSIIKPPVLLGTQANLLAWMLDCDVKYVMANLVIHLDRKYNG